MTNPLTITVQELQQWLVQQDFTLLDVREEPEVAIARIDGSIHIPMNLIPLRHNELDDRKPIVVYCHHGMRSLHVGIFLLHAGFENIYNLQGGIDAWSAQIDPTVPRY